MFCMSCHVEMNVDAVSRVTVSRVAHRLPRQIESNRGVHREVFANISPALANKPSLFSDEYVEEGARKASQCCRRRRPSSETTQRSRTAGREKARGGHGRGRNR